MATSKNTFCAIVIDAPLVQFLRSDGSKGFRFPKIQLPEVRGVYKNTSQVQEVSQSPEILKNNSILRNLLEQKTTPVKPAAFLEGEYISYSDEQSATVQTAV
jgi:hypothetical protein